MSLFLNRYQVLGEQGVFSGILWFCSLSLQVSNPAEQRFNLQNIVCNRYVCRQVVRRKVIGSFADRYQEGRCDRHANVSYNFSVVAGLLALPPPCPCCVLPLRLCSFFPCLNYLNNYLEYEMNSYSKYFEIDCWHTLMRIFFPIFSKN